MKKAVKIGLLLASIIGISTQGTEPQIIEIFMNDNSDSIVVNGQSISYTNLRSHMQGYDKSDDLIVYVYFNDKSHMGDINSVNKNLVRLVPLDEVRYIKTDIRNYDDYLDAYKSIYIYDKANFYVSGNDLHLDDFDTYLESVEKSDVVNLYIEEGIAYKYIDPYISLLDSAEVYFELKKL